MNIIQRKAVARQTVSVYKYWLKESDQITPVLTGKSELIVAQESSLEI